jgi:hypothetical protein
MPGLWYWLLSEGLLSGSGSDIDGVTTEFYSICLWTIGTFLLMEFHFDSSMFIDPRTPGYICYLSYLY